MHCTLLAPLLSATSRMDRIWIMAPLLSHRAGHELDDLPALVLGDGAVLHDLHAVADLELVLLVVSLVAVVMADVLLVHGVARATHDLDHHGLVHLVGDDLAQQLAPEGMRRVLCRGRGLSLARRVGHGYSVSFC